MSTVLKLAKKIGLLLWNVTWCALQNVVGALISIPVLFVSKKTVYRGMLVFYHRFGFTFSVGAFAFISAASHGAGQARSHLYGHYLQSCICGPAYLFLVSIPQLFVRIPPLKRHRLERGKTEHDIFAEKTALSLSARFGE